MSKPLFMITIIGLILSVIMIVVPYVRAAYRKEDDFSDKEITTVEGGIVIGYLPSGILLYYSLVNERNDIMISFFVGCAVLIITICTCLFIKNKKIAENKNAEDEKEGQSS